MRWGDVARPLLTFSLFCAAMLLEGRPARAEEAATRPAAPRPSATAPASQPGERLPLVRIADRIDIIQADFEVAISGRPEAMYEGSRDSVMAALVQDRLFWLYVEDHPELVSDAQLEERIEQTMKIAKIDSREELVRRLEEKGSNLELFRKLTRIGLAQGALADRGSKLAADDAFVRKLFEQNPWEFDTTHVHARHILLRVPAYATPAERKAVRERLAKMREDILAGRRTWEQCVAESDSAAKNGDLGRFTRHLMMNEFVSEAAFKLEPGKLSEPIETPLGYHLIEVQERVAGSRSFEDSKRDIQRWLRQKPYADAITEAFDKYPVVGLRAPRRPDPSVFARPEPELPRPPATSRAPATQPTTRRATAKRTPATRPAAVRRPASRPASRGAP